MATVTGAKPVSAREFADIYEACKNWGRWGPDDERGALNYITKEPGDELGMPVVISEFDCRHRSAQKQMANDRGIGAASPPVWTIGLKRPLTHLVGTRP